METQPVLTPEITGIVSLLISLPAAYLCFIDALDKSGFFDIACYCMRIF